jgi:hypothetical protein
VIPSHHTTRRPLSRLAFHASRIVIDVGVLMVLGSMSLPFVAAAGFHQRAVAADALPVLILMLPIFVVTLLPDQTAPVPAPLGWASLALAAAALPYAVLKYLDASTLAATLHGSVGTGARILVFGVCVGLVGIGIGLARSLLHLPVAGSYPAARQAPAEARPAAQTRPPAAQGAPPAAAAAAQAASPARTASAATASRRPGLSRRPGPTRRRQPTPAQPTSEPSAARSPRRVPAAVPQPADPDTEPTLPAQRPVQPWSPDDLDDLFS